MAVSDAGSIEYNIFHINQKYHQKNPRQYGECAKGLIMKQHEVLWAPVDYVDGAIFDPHYYENLNWPNIVYYEPEPAFKAVIKDRDKSVQYLQCPAVQKFYKNTFAIRCPVDLTLKVDTDNAGNKILRSMEYDQHFYNLHIVNRFDQNKFYATINLEFNYLFLSNSPISIQVIAASLGTADFAKNIRIIPAEFDIGKWYRPVAPAFEIIDENIPLKFNRGDITHYVKFNTNDNVVLKRFEIDQDLRNSLSAFVKVKNYVPKNNMEQNYEMAAPYIDVIRNKLFKTKRCPFKNLFDKSK